MDKDVPYYTSPGVLTVDLAAVAANYRLYRDMCGPGCAVAGVVKADAYGLGMAQVAPVLEQSGCPLFFVATLEEGIGLRSVTKRPVYVLNGFWHGAEREYTAYDLVPVLNGLDEVARWSRHAAWIGHALPAVLHIDTGMNRLGLAPGEADRLAEDKALLDGLDLRLILSHFACADEADHPMNAAQAARFEKAAARFPGVSRSLANSSGAMRDPAWRYEMIRPGMAVYGLNPVPEKENPMRPAVTLDTRLLQVRTAPGDETVGYGASHALGRATRIGTVALGYADGFLRAGGGRAVLYHRGKPCPVIGRVSMDLVTVDLGGAEAVPGDRLEILGPHQDADALASALGTIGYEVLTGLGSRWARRYIKNQ